MIVYVETNFVLELVFQQEESDSCNTILELAENGKIGLVLPAYSLAEPMEKLVRRRAERKKLITGLRSEITQLRRKTSNIPTIEALGNLSELLAQNNLDDDLQFERVGNRLLDVAEVIPLDTIILRDAKQYEDALSPQDALVMASVVTSLNEKQGELACFLNRNHKDFGTADIRNLLTPYNCRVISSFQNGLNFISSNT